MERSVRERERERDGIRIVGGKGRMTFSMVGRCTSESTWSMSTPRKVFMLVHLRACVCVCACTPISHTA